MSSSPGAPGAPRTWRASRAEPPGQSRHVQRAVLTILGLILAAILAWMLWWWLFLPSVHFVSLPIVDYDDLVVPPLRFATEDVEAFSCLPRRGQAVVLSDLESSDSITTVANRLPGGAGGRKDTLIFYLRVYGVSGDGEAWVLCSDYLRTAEGGRYPLKELFAQIERSPAAKKLLILDAGDLACDPRLGLLVNEFPQLLAEEVRRVQDPGLWVLASNRALEVSHVSESEKRSAFGYFVTEGLMRAADDNGNRNGRIELDELVDFVRKGVAGWVSQDSGGTETQTPWLLRGGEGEVEPPEGLTLLPISGGGPEGASPEDAAGAPPQNADARSRAAKELSALLDKGWGLRDRIQQRGAVEPWSPVDYAPHLWRQYEELLLAYERQYRSGTKYNPANLADEVRANILPLEDLLAGQPLPPATGKATIVSRLADSHRRFLAKLNEGQFEQLAQDQRASRYLELVRRKNDFVFRAVDYVRWYAAAGRHLAQRHRLYPPIADFLTELRSFVDGLGSLESGASTLSGPGQVQETLDTLARQAQTLEGLRREIKEEGLYKDAADLIDAATKNPAAKEVAGRMDSLLATPLLPAAVRTKLLRARAALEQPFDIHEQAAGRSSQPLSPSRWPRQLADQAVLEERLVALADPATKLPTPPSAGAATAEALLAKYRQLGKALERFYERLPEEINKEFQPGDSAAGTGHRPQVARAQRCERLLRAVDARDAQQIREDVAAIAVRPVRFPPSAEFRLAVEGPAGGPLALDRSHPTPLEVVLKATGRPPGTAQWMLDYNQSELAIDTEGGTTPVLPQRWTQFSLDREVSSLKFAVIAKVSNGRETTVTVKVRWGNQSESRPIVVRLPAPNVVDLVVDQIGGAVPRRIEGTERFRLRPFPNRMNRYRWALVNRSGRAKTVQVQWFSVPEFPPGEQPLRDLVLDDSGSLRRGLKPVIPPVEMKLPATDEAVPIGFPAPKPVAAAPQAGTPPAAKPEAPPAPSASPPEPWPHATLACVIRETGEGDQSTWIKWLDFAACPPKKYVAPHVRYDAREGKIRIEVQPVAAENIPPLSPETPIRVVWNTQGDLGPDVAVKKEAVITAAGQTASLYADVSPSVEKKVRVRLAVDGYPRAFVYEVRCDHDWPEIPLDGDLRDVHFTAPPQDQAYKVPLAAPIPVVLEVDAPEDAFLQPGDVVEVRIVAEDSDRELCPEERRRFFSDRQTTILPNQLTAQGEMQILAKVGDFEIPMRAGGLENTKVRIAAELRLAGRAPVPPDYVRIVLDAAPPVFEIQTPDRPVPRGQSVMVAATGTDLSGIDKMEFGFDLENSDEFDKKIQPVVVRQPSADGTWHAALPTKDLEPGQYRVLVRATDRAGNAGKQHSLVSIGPPAPSQTPPVSQTSTINGRVTLQNGRPLPNMRVTLRGTSLAAVTDSEGRFTFHDVPHGKYQMDVKGTGLGKELSGSKEIVLPAPTEPAVVELRLEW